MNMKTLDLKFNVVDKADDKTLDMMDDFAVLAKKYNLAPREALAVIGSTGASKIFENANESCHDIVKEETERMMKDVGYKITKILTNSQLQNHFKDNADIIKNFKGSVDSADSLKKAIDQIMLNIDFDPTEVAEVLCIIGLNIYCTSMAAIYKSKNCDFKK